MREIGFVAALVLIILSVVYFVRLPTALPQNGHALNSTAFQPAILAAKNAGKAVDAEKRRKWVIEFQAKAYDQSMPDATYSTEGENAEILVIQSSSLNSGTCTTLAQGSQGREAAKEGFAEIVCRDRTTGAEYRSQLFPQN